MIVLRVVGFLIGVFVVVATFGSSIRTVVLPRAVPARVGRAVFLLVRAAFNLWIGRRASYARRDRVLALYAPAALLALLIAWLVLILLGYTAMLWSLEGHTFISAFTLSGSAIFTLGFSDPPTFPNTLLVLSEAAVGLAELALLIGYLPTIYNAFARRERLVTKLEVRAGSPPAGVTALVRFYVLGRADSLADEMWAQWEDWFVDVEESHTSQPSLPFFRSPQPDHNWVTAAGAVLDAAALRASVVDGPRDVKAELCIRAGYLCLRRIADFFQIPHDPDPRPEDPIAVTRGEFDEACEQLERAGVPLTPDRERAWRDFAGWRVNYDTVLIALASFTTAPAAPWSSDRGLVRYRPPLFSLRAPARPRPVRR